MTVSSTLRVSRSLTVCLVGALLLLAGCSSEPQGPSIEVGERSEPIEGATARFASPEDSTVVDSSNVHVVVETANFVAGTQTDTDRAQQIANSDNGQHVHVIVDNEPYLANYETGNPFPVGTLSNGAHTAFVFPSRSYHESVKSETAWDVVHFYVGEESGEFALDRTEPTIIYSRPKGSYAGQAANRILMDFYLINAELGPDSYKARYTIQKAGSDSTVASKTLEEWTPAFATGLTEGTYDVTLELLTPDGDVAPGAWNSTTREIEVDSFE
jgi:hypothetical protein